MPIRMTGLNSGLDTESIIAALMSAQRTKQTKVENKKTKLEWKKEQWASLNTKIYNFYTNSLSKMRMKSAYMTKAATSSNTSKVTAKASTSAATGSYSVKVNQVASAQKVTSGKLGNLIAKRDDKGDVVKDSNGNIVYEEGKVTSKTRLVDLKDAGFGEGTQIKVAAGDKTVFLEVDDKTTIGDFVGKLSDAGLNATFDEQQQRFFISSAKSGKDGKFTITSGKMEDVQKKATDNLKKLIGYDSLSSANKTTADNIMAGLQTGSKSVDDVIERLTTLANDYSDKEAKRKATELYTTEAKASVINGFEEEVRNSLEGKEETYHPTIEEKIEYLKKKGYKTDIPDGETDPAKKEEAFKKTLDKYADKEAEKRIKSNDYDYKSKIENATQNGITAKEINDVKIALGPAGTDGSVTLKEDKEYTFDDRMARTMKTNTDIDSAAKEYSKQMNNFLSDQNGAVTGDGEALKVLGLGNVNGNKIPAGTSSDMAVIEAGDTEIEYNGAILTSDTTNITVAGIELNVLGTTGDEEVNISVTNDTSGVYDTIKEFISEYNAILKEMNTLYNAGSAKDYDVLSDEEKDAMSDSEVEKWETKIKDSLLRRDTTLGGIISSFKNKMVGTYAKSGGGKYSLASIGISTSQDYKEGGLLHILGDEDDAEYADKTNRLKKMLDEDPDAVIGVLTSLTDSLYSDLQKKMSATTMSSALTFYNDKEMSSQLSDYKDEISKWQSRLDEMEDKYYKQFSAMETALANLQSQQNSLASMLGGGN
ncbi:MAG: flagellar filament capping protein FliD [Lachnospiraceae bacterium]|nr:flagellar filament capping protein FliD [Lachnospiraceae bacterium]